MAVFLAGAHAQASGFWCYGIQGISNDRIWLDMDDTNNGLKKPTLTQSWIDGYDMQEHFSKTPFSETLCQDSGDFNLSCTSANGSSVTINKVSENLVKVMIKDPNTRWYENGVEYNFTFCQAK